MARKGERGGLGCGGAAMIVIALTVAALWWAWPSADDTRSARDAVLSGNPKESVTPDEFRQAYRDDAAAASARFQGKAVVLNGAVSGVRESNGDELVVSFASSDGVGVETSVDVEDRARVEALRPGMHAVVHCERIIDIVGVRVLAQCRLAK